MNKQPLAKHVQTAGFPAATVLEHPALRLSGGPASARQGHPEVPMLGTLRAGDVIGLSGGGDRQQRLVAAWLACNASADSGVLWLTDHDPVELRTDCLAIDSGQSRNYVQALLSAMKYNLARGDVLSRLAVAENLFVFRAAQVSAATLRRIGAGFHHRPLRLVIIESLPQGLDIDGLRRLAARLGAAVLWLGADQPVQRLIHIGHGDTAGNKTGRGVVACQLVEGSLRRVHHLRLDLVQARVEPA